MKLKDFIKKFSQNNEVYVENRNNYAMGARWNDKFAEDSLQFMDWELKFTDIADKEVLRIKNVERGIHGTGITIVIDTDEQQFHFLKELVTRENAPLWFFEHIHGIVTDGVALDKTICPMKIDDTCYQAKRRETEQGPTESYSGCSEKEDVSKKDWRACLTSEEIDWQCTVRQFAPYCADEIVKRIIDISEDSKSDWKSGYAQGFSDGILLLSDKNLRRYIGMSETIKLALTDVDEKRFDSCGTSLKEVLEWIDCKITERVKRKIKHTH